MITFDNYYNNTKATFKGCKTPKRLPNYISASGSKYWYGKDYIGYYVIRCSNHWTNICVIYDKNKSSYAERQCKTIASCLWKIKTNSKDAVISGKCYLSDFKHK